MSEERRKILEMLASGKITLNEAEGLLSALVEGESKQKGEQDVSFLGKKPPLKYLRVVVEPSPDSKKKERVNIRVPLNLIRAGLKWVSFIPKDAQVKVNEALSEKGIEMDFTQMTPQNLEDLIQNLSDFTIDVEGEETVKIFCE